MTPLQNAISWFNQNVWVEKVAFLLIFALFLAFLFRIINKAIAKNITETDNRYRIRKISNIFFYALLISVALFTFSDKLGSFGITLGLASAGIAFALQEVIVSIAGWLNIMVSGQIKVGQRVKIGSICGDVIDISVMKTSIMEVGDWIKGDLYNGRITTLSNNFVFSTPVQNYSADYPFLWDEISIPLRLESDFKLAQKIFTQITTEVCGDYAKQSAAKWETMKNKYLIEKASVLPSVGIQFDQNWITFTIRYVVDYQKRRSTKNLLYTRVLEEIAKNQPNLKIATATMEVTNLHITEDKKTKN